MEISNQMMGYDRTSAMFSPDGRLLQVEYAEKTVSTFGSTSIGLVCKDGILLIADRGKLDELAVKESVAKIYEIDEHIAAAGAGILGDIRVLIERARVVAQQHRVTYDEPIDTEAVVKEIGDIQQVYSQYGGVRPFGVNFIIAGINVNKEAKLFITDVTGSYGAYLAGAIGKNSEKIKEELKKQYKENLSLKEGVKLALSIFKKILQKAYSIDRFELVIIKKDDTKFRRFFGKQIDDFIKQTK